MTAPFGVSPEPQAIVACYRVLSHYFTLSATGEVGRYVHEALRSFRVPHDYGEHRSPALPGVPPVYQLLEHPPDDPAGYQVRYNEHLLMRALQPDRVVNHIMWHVQGEAVRLTGDFLLVHAGSVTTPAGGEAMVLPAHMEAGKTTLTAGLVRAGFGYLSDEAAAIDPVTRAVYPFPKALNLEMGSMALFPELAEGRPTHELGCWHIHADELRSGSLAGPAPVRWIVTPRYRPGAPTSLVPTSRAEGLAILLENALGLRRYRLRGVTLLADIAREAKSYRLVSGNLDEAVAVLTDLVR